MTHEVRQRIRAAVDARVRDRRQRFIDAGELAVCTGCGCDQEIRTPGCKTCGDRHRKWRLRTDPAYRARVREYERARNDHRVAYERERRRLRKEAALRPSASTEMMNT